LYSGFRWADRTALYAAFTAASVLLARIKEDAARLVDDPPTEIQGNRVLPRISSLSHPDSGTRIEFQIVDISPFAEIDRLLYISGIHGGLVWSNLTQLPIPQGPVRETIELVEIVAGRDKTVHLTTMQHLTTYLRRIQFWVMVVISTYNAVEKILYVIIHCRRPKDSDDDPANSSETMAGNAATSDQPEPVGGTHPTPAHRNGCRGSHAQR
jgi:hypothetical protein